MSKLQIIDKWLRVSGEESPEKNSQADSFMKEIMSGPLLSCSADDLQKIKDDSLREIMKKTWEKLFAALEENDDNFLSTAISDLQDQFSNQITGAISVQQNNPVPTKNEPPTEIVSADISTNSSL